MANYRAIRSSYGFRSRLWEKGDIAERVSAEEAKKIPEHFVLIPHGETTEKPVHPSLEPREPTTLSEMQDDDLKARKAGKEFMADSAREPATPKKARAK